MGYLQIIVLIVTLVLGGMGGYYFEHSQVLLMEGRIKDQKIEASKVLAIEMAKVSTAEQTQRDLNTQLDKAHETLISSSNNYSIKQSTLIDSLQFTDGRKGCGESTGKSSDTLLHSTDAEEFTWVSKKLLKYLAGESKRAEQDGIDKNELLTFVISQNCGITK